MKKIMLICGASHTVLNFRSSLISALIENNYEVAVVALDSEKKDEIEKLGVKVFVCGENKNRDVSPFKLKRIPPRYGFHLYDKTQHFRRACGEKSGG